MLTLYLLFIGGLVFWFADASAMRVFIVVAWISNYATPLSFGIAMAIYLFLGLIVPRLHADKRSPPRPATIRKGSAGADDLIKADELLFGGDRNPFLYQLPALLNAEQRARVVATTDVILNSRGQRLFTRSWKPADAADIKGLMFLCHGHGDHSGLELSQIGYKFAVEGYWVHSLDYAGFGWSDGLHGYIPSFDRLVGDTQNYFDGVKLRDDPHRRLKWILQGHSMGGAVAIKLALRQPDRWDGCIFVAPMCGIKKSVAPPVWVAKLFMLIVPLIPTLPVTPTKLPPGISYADPMKAKWVLQDPLHYFAKARLGSASEMLQVMNEIESKQKTISVPFLVAHGTGDKVTDPEMSQRLYDAACSTNKQIKLYDGFGHALMTGEFDANCKIVYADLIKWSNQIKPAVQKSAIAD